MNKIKSTMNALLQKLKKLLQKCLPVIENAEEGFHFPLGHIFYHGIFYLGILAVIVGAIVALYSISPVFERSVDKPDFLKRHEISAEDALAACSNPVRQRAKTKPKTKPQSQPMPQEEIRRPEISLALLEAALPDVQFTKEGLRNTCEHSEGHYEYGDWGDWIYPRRCYEYGTVDSKFAKNLRDMLQRWFPGDSVTQQETVDRMANHLNFYTKKSRLKIYNTSMDWIGNKESIEEISEAWEIIAAIDSVIGNVADERLTEKAETVFAEFADFMEKNPENGKPVLLKTLELERIAGGSDRLETFKIARSYYKKLDIDAPNTEDWKPGEWKKATERFLSLKELHGAGFVKNLSCFFQAYLGEIENRVKKNRQLRRDYERHLEYAEREAAAVRAERRDSIGLAGKIAGVGVGISAIILIILLLASLQHSVKRLEKALAAREFEEGKRG